MFHLTDCDEFQNAMSRSPSRLRFTLVAITVGLVWLTLTPMAWTQTAQPNIVVILADDLGYGDVGFNGCPDIPTPNIDSLAANGVLCTNGYATHPYCSPSRAGIITGRYQQRYGYDSGPETDNDNPRLGLPLNELTLPQLLKPAGYVSGAIGKWHLGFAPDFLPTKRGFDEFFGFTDASSHYYNAHLLRDETPIIEPAYLTDAFTREGVAFINNHATQPFFLYLAYNAVHKPYDKPPPVYLAQVNYITDPARRLYAAMVVALDAGVGQILQTLQTNNILDNTLIFFLSDNGAPFDSPRDEDRSNNSPLRGYKMDVLEGGIRVPFAVQWTERLPSQVVYDAPVSLLDVVSTAVTAAGISLPTDRVYDGLDIVPYLAGEQASPERTLFWRWFGLGPDGPLGSLNTIWAVRNGPLKLVVIRDRDDKKPALYDLPGDISERYNLAATQPERVADLERRYAQWTLDTIPDIWQKDSDTILLPMVLAGDWNDFNKDDLNPPWNLTRVTAPDEEGTPDAYNWFKNTIHVATTGGDTTPGTHSFTLVGHDSYSTQWGGATINIDGATDIPFFSGAVLGPANTVVFEDNFYYSMRIIDCADQPGVNLKLAVMKTTAPPVSVSRSGQTPAQPTPRDPIIVSITTSQSKSVEERIYLRWSTDSFITSHLIEAAGSGVSYSATIPPQSGKDLVLYTILTSTSDLAGYSTSGTIDSLALATTGVFNAMPAILPTITTQPANTRVIEGQTAKFDVATTGTPPLLYQWTKNGAKIDGATQKSYRTPPTTEDDDGAVFAVIVSNRAGSVTSNDAILNVKPAAP